MAKTFTLEVVTPEKLVFSGEITQLIAPAFDGYLGVMAGHAPLLAVLQPGEILIDGDRKRTCYSTSGGFLEVTPKRATVLSESAEPIEAIDVKRAEEARERAAKRMAEQKPGLDPDRARAALKRAENRLRVARKRKP